MHRTNRYRRLPWAGCALIGLIAVLLLSQADRVRANNHLTRIEELMVGAHGNSKIQFIVIRLGDSAQNQWGPTNCLQSAAMLVSFDATGRQTGMFKFPENPPTGGTFNVLMATPEFANLPGAPTPDIIIPPLLNPISGKVCFKSNFANPFTFVVNLCLSYGSFTGDTEGAGPPAAALPIVNTVSLRRIPGTGFFGGNLNADFQLTSAPTPTNIAGATFPANTMPGASQVEQGANLFNNEPFLGNGRTCASCHRANVGFRVTPADVQSRFSTLADSFDPLFIAETLPSSFDPGFDFNLNSLVLTAPVASNAPCTGELRGLITSSDGGLAKVLARVSGTTYLVYGGVNPPLAGTVSDGVCSATVSSVTPGDLDALENPRRMRTSASPDFPEGRALILENIDGFSNPPVFRKAPPLLNLSRTASFGFSGNVPDLRAFATGAVIQHFPRTLARSDVGTNPDFRLPTLDELAAMEALMLAQEFPRGTDPNKFNLDRFAVTPEQQRGRDLFFGSAKCSQCHGGPVLAQTTVQILNQPLGVNGSFNTGVVNQLVNSAIGDDLPCEPSTTSVGPCGSREFSVPQLFNVKNLGPFFHDASARDLFQAVDFYNSSAFNTSPAGVAIGGIALNVSQVNDIVAFLEGLTESAGPSTPQATAGSLLALEDTPLTLTLTGSDADGDDLTFAIVAGPSNGSLSPITSLTATSAQLTYTPNGDFNGSDSFSFTAADSGGHTSAPATVSISVRAMNDAPTATPQSLTTVEDTPLAIPVASFASDPDQDALFFFLETPPGHGFLSGLFSDLVTYTPVLNFNGTDSFSLRVRDRLSGLGFGDGVCSDPATVSLTVTPVNDPPSALPQFHSIGVDTPIPLTLTASDADGDSLTFALTIGPSNGSLSPITPLTATSAGVTYTPNPNFSGLDNFTFRVSDPEGLTSDATIMLRVGVPTISLLNAVSFPPTVVGTQSPSQVVLVTNTGILEASVFSATTAGDFSIGSNSCGTLAPAQTCQLSLNFAPAQAGLRSGTLTLVTNAAGSPHVVALSGTGLFALRVNKAGAGNGTVTSSPAGISCGEDCNETFEQAGAQFTLTAAAFATSAFASWTGCDSVSGNQCTVVIIANRNVTATFNLLPNGITVVAPNGGEEFLGGTTQTIQWAFTGNPGATTKVELLRRSSGRTVRQTLTPSAPIGNEETGTGSFVWNIPTTQAAASSYRIRVESNTVTSVGDSSDATFTIRRPTITVTSPNGGEVLARGSTVTITWSFTGGPGESVTIQLRKGKNLDSTLTTSAPIGSNGSGAFLWAVPVGQATGSNYKIRIISNASSTIKDNSNSSFTIQ